MDELVQFLKTNNILIFIAFAAGIWRVIDGRGQEWLPISTVARNLVTITLALIASLLTFGITPWVFWFTTVSFLSLISGYTKWESYIAMIPRYGLPPLLASIVAAQWLDISVLNAAEYMLAGILVGIIYPSMSRWPFLGVGPLKYLPEFSAGAAMIGGIGLL